MVLLFLSLYSLIPRGEENTGEEQSGPRWLKIQHRSFLSWSMTCTCIYYELKKVPPGYSLALALFRKVHSCPMFSLSLSLSLLNRFNWFVQPMCLCESVLSFFCYSSIVPSRFPQAAKQGPVLGPDWLCLRDRLSTPLQTFTFAKA